MKELRVKDLIALLQKADPEAIVLGEFEGGVFGLEPNDVRVGQTFKFYSSTSDEYWTRWNSQAVLDHVIERGGKFGPWEPSVLLWAGQSERSWSNRLDGEPTEENE